MGLEQLPEELLVIILKQLDSKSIYSLYNAGVPHVVNVISSGCIKKCDLSLSTMASINTLKTQFFEDISTNLQELDLKAVQGLTRKALLPVMKRMINLSKLNLSYTSITIFDFLQIYEQCPSIKNICIDYEFTYNKDDHFSQELVLKCQEVFANMEKVHFVGSKENLLHSSLPEIILQNTNLISLTYTLAKNSNMMTYYKYTECKPINLNNFNIFYPNNFSLCQIQNLNVPVIFRRMQSDYEFFAIILNKIECSPSLKIFWEQNLNITPTVKTTLHSLSYSQVFMCWNKETTTFDKTFFDNLLSVVAPLFPIQVNNDNKDSSLEDEHENAAPLTSDWIWVRQHMIHDDATAHMYQFPTKRMATMYDKLDYDEMLSGKQNVDLTITFWHSYPVTLSPQSNFLVKLTYLSLTPKVRYSPEFFTVLFRCCTNLVTLNIEMGRSVSQISKSIGLSQSLKNFRLAGRGIQFQNLFSKNRMCLCKTLENVMIVDSSPKHVKNIGEPEQLIDCCKKLYYLYISINMNEAARAKRLTLLNKAKKKMERPYLHLELVCNEFSYKTYDYNPYVDVFKLYRIKNFML